MRRIRGRQRLANLSVEVVITGRSRATGLAAWLVGVAPARARGRVTVAIASDARVRELNRQFRQKDAATDVLSFAAGAAAPGRVALEPELGDIVIAAGVAKQQARAAGHPLGTEFRVLALHGLLHLLGYDHDRDDGRMARVERRLRRQGGLLEGLIERSPLAGRRRPQSRR